ncbi:NUDIX domain-containing protein [Actinopolymorpha alba]|uniref:NUDIX domain-containing protein n=1 Tax=Actinopolymorpha alba TaxID=533267 RepID=UPI0007C706C4|nr:NUDIX hydrolase [Actinopolymorpha alba]
MTPADDNNELDRGPLPSKLESHGAVFFDTADRLLLVKAAYGWGFPGGVAEQDETPRATVRREVEEEIGLVKEPGALLVVDWQPSCSRNLTEAQRAAGWSERFMDGLILEFDGGVLTADDIASIKLDPDEIEDYTFLPLDQALRRMDSPQSGRARAAVKARETGTVVYLENGNPPS